MSSVERQLIPVHADDLCEECREEEAAPGRTVCRRCIRERQAEDRLDLLREK